MILRELHGGRGSPFEGDRELRLLSIPEGARVLRARVILTPILGANDEALVQTIDFGGRTWGATRNRGPTPMDPAWVEVDFHTRRTLHEVTGSGLAGATFQVDLGGAFAEVKDNGTFLAPTDPDAEALTLAGSPEILPGLSVARFRLTGSAGAATSPDVTSISVRSVPTNVSLSLGSQAPFFNHPGEMTEPTTSDDFAQVLEAFLTETKVQNGFYVVALLLHSDAITEIDLELEIEIERRQSVLPAGLDQVAMPYDFGGLPQSGEGVLEVELPPGSRVTGTEGRVIGAFEESRVVLGPTGEVSPDGDAEVSASTAQAQLLSFDSPVPATAVDLLLAAVSRTARLRLNLADDLDGKPGSESFLLAQVEFGLDRESAGQRTWISVDLPAEFQFESRDQCRYWLILQTLDGEVRWAASSAGADAPALQHTTDGGLSWRETRLEAGGAAGFFRFRHLPSRFEMPIELQVGSGKDAQRVSLAGLEAQGSVDLDLSLPKIATALNDFAANIPGRCPEAEHLDNGDFRRWFTIGDQLGVAADIDNFDLSVMGSRLAVTPDGRGALLVTPGAPSSDDAGAGPTLHFVDLACRTLQDSLPLPGSGVAEVVETVITPDGRRAYVGLPGELHVVDLVDRRVIGSRNFVANGSLESLALSPDGGRLYLGFSPPRIDAIDAVSSKAVISGQPVIQNVPSAPPAELAVSRDGSLLFAVLVESDASDQLSVYSAQTLDQEKTIGLSFEAGALDVYGDRSQAVIVHPGGTISFVDALLGTVFNLSLDVTLAGRLTIEPNGRRLFVAAENSVVVVDIERRRVLKTVESFAVTIDDLAVTPTGDSLVVLGDGLRVIPLGAPQPAEWAITGEARRFCSKETGSVLVLGSFPEQHAPVADTSVGLSQVVPVTPDCPYEITFEALATEFDAVAELFWLGDGCALLQKESLPITQLEQGSPILALHRTRLMAPAEARQVELQFSAPGGLLALRRASVRGTTEALENGDLAERHTGGLPRGWELAPAEPVGFVISPSAGGPAQLINGGPEPFALVQTVRRVSGANSFVLVFEGQALAQAVTEPAPAVEVQWLDGDGGPMGPPSSLEIAPDSSGRLTAEGPVPEAATSARLEVMIPPGVSLEVSEISLRTQKVQKVPLTFVAQAPGSLRITDWRVAFEPGEVGRPSPPVEGPCSPTPLAAAPGEPRGKDCFCCRCHAPTEMKETTTMVTEAGRAIESGRCARCGAEVVRIGGAAERPVTVFSPRRLPTGPAVRERRGVITRLPPALRSILVTAPARNGLILRGSDKSAVTLTAVRGIGERREAQLRAIGIDSVVRLATAKPAEIQSLPGLHRSAAEQLIASARALLADS